MRKDLYQPQYSALANAISKVGAFFLGAFPGQICILVFQAIVVFIHDIRNRTLETKQIIWQIYFTGFEALGLLSIVAVLFGSVVVMQALTAMPKVGFGDYFGDIMVIVIIRELGPIFTAFLVAGRTGSALSTYIGNMKVESEIDALETLGINPNRYLVMPAVIGGVFSMVILSIFFNFLAIFAGYGCALLYSYVAGIGMAMDLVEFSNSIFSAMSFIDVFLMIIKPALFGFTIMGISCFCGLRLNNDRRAVPQAASSSVVLSFTWIIVLNGLVTSLYFPSYMENLGSFI